MNLRSSLLFCIICATISIGYSEYTTKFIRSKRELGLFGMFNRNRISDYDRQQEQIRKANEVKSLKNK